jgi:tRNA-2-methylthio-N6-dimethylallyladenosine synthase
MSKRVIIDAVARRPDQLMPCFNVPFQSGDNGVLRYMRRGYRRERYLEIIRNIRRALPDAAITADCIVGFPGETEEQFQCTLSLMEEVRYARCCCS